eukprot:6213923-Pleurochrysis_carterae.AAC.1
MVTPASEGAAQMFFPPTIFLSKFLVGKRGETGQGEKRDLRAPRAGDERLHRAHPTRHPSGEGGIASVRPRRKALITTGAEAEGAGAGSSHPQRLSSETGAQQSSLWLTNPRAGVGTRIGSQNADSNSEIYSDIHFVHFQFDALLYYLMAFVDCLSVQFATFGFSSVVV